MANVSLPDGFLDELKSRLKPSDVIGRKVKLTRKGKEWVGLSPFTAEKTPSFYVNDAKGIFKDFSSGLGGDIITFLRETERLEFMEAVEKLAEEAGLAMPTASPAEAARYDRLARLKAACSAANVWFQEQLRSGAGEAARTYLQDKRGLGPEAWTRWGIGYVPDDWRLLRTHLLRQGFTDEELVGAGLIKTSDKGGEPYDLFRGRVMFPIADAKGDVIAFGARTLDPDGKPKYLNSPDTDLFHKSRVLYNYKRARESLGYGGRGGLIVCEGYMDVIALGEAGFDNAVAPLGTALTGDQLAALWKAGPDPIMCFDGDAAGLRAAHKAVDTSLPHVLPDRSVYFAFLPDGQDPDDLLNTSGGRGAMAALLEAPKPLIEVLWLREQNAEPLDTPERKAGLEARLNAAAGVIEHPGVKAAYQRDLRSRMREFFWQQGRRGQASKTGPNVKCETRRPPALGHLVRAATSPDLVDEWAELLVSLFFGHRVSDAVSDAILQVYFDKGSVSRPEVSSVLNAAGHGDVADAFDAYPPVDVVRPGTEAAKEWSITLQAFHRQGRDGLAPEDVDAEAYFARDDSMRALHRLVAERQRLKSEASEAQLVAHEARKTSAQNT